MSKTGESVLPVLIPALFFDMSLYSILKVTNVNSARSLDKIKLALLVLRKILLVF